MTTQLTIFNTGIVCDHCKSDPGRKDHSAVVWNGFIDKDNNQYCCYRCRSLHYQLKGKTDLRGMYSEFPVIILNDPEQLNEIGSLMMEALKKLDK